MKAEIFTSVIKVSTLHRLPSISYNVGSENLVLNRTTSCFFFSPSSHWRSLRKFIVHIGETHLGQSMGMKGLIALRNL